MNVRGFCGLARFWAVFLCGFLLTLAAPSPEAFAAEWARGVELSPPAGAGSNPGAVAAGVSCASAGNCAAVGIYTDSSGNQQGLLLTETSGNWDTGVEAVPPANA